MNKEELLAKLQICVKHCQNHENDDGAAAYMGAIVLAEQLDEPPKEPCEFCSDKVIVLRKISCECCPYGIVEDNGEKDFQEGSCAIIRQHFKVLELALILSIKKYNDIVSYCCGDKCDDISSCFKTNCESCQKDYFIKKAEEELKEQK